MVSGILSPPPVLAWIRIDSIILLLYVLPSLATMRLLLVGVMKHVHSMVGHTTLARFSSSDIALVFSFPRAPMPFRFANVALFTVLAGYLIDHPLLPLWGSLLLDVADQTAKGLPPFEDQVHIVPLELPPQLV